MASTPVQFKNRLLSYLSDEDLDRLRPNLEAVTLDLRFVLEAANQPIRFVYFPESGLTSIVAHSKRGRSIEVGLFGREGMSGLSIVMGDDRSANETFIQAPGAGFRIPAAKLIEVMADSVSMRQCFLRYAQAFLCQTSQRR